MHLNRTAALLTLLLASPAAASTPGPLTFTPLAQQIGAQESIKLNVYFLGFPASMKPQLRAAVQARLTATPVVDAKPWWEPNIPKFGAQSLALAPAPSWLPPELTPPDGMVRYDPISMAAVPNPLTGQTVWLPQRELAEGVAELHASQEAINLVEHDGSMRDLPFVVDRLRVRVVSPADMQGLVQALERSRRTYSPSNPAQSFELFSYNTLFDWLRDAGVVRAPAGGAALVFMNLAALELGARSFYAEPGRDVVPTAGVATPEVQYPPAVASNPTDQAALDLYSNMLGGGLHQAKMFAALETVCAAQTTVAASGIGLPGAQPDQRFCAHWRLEPIRNLAGPAGSYIFASDATDLLAGLTAGTLTQAELLDGIGDDLFEMYRYGLLAPNIKANNTFSEKYELRSLVVDLRYDGFDLCLLGKLQIGTATAAAVAECGVEQVLYPTEKTYTVQDVFDVDLAKASLSSLSPADWQVNLVPMPFGLRPDGSTDPVASVQTRAFLRDFLNEPQVVDPQTGALVRITHPPLYRDLQVPTTNGQLVDISCAWERGLDFFFTTDAMTLPVQQGGLGIYDLIWPDVQVTEAPPFRDTGRAAVKAHALVLTPAPGGPLGERWGTFPVNLTASLATGIVSDFGGGSFWSSVAGTEDGGGQVRRDFTNIVPQYYLGPNKGNGEAVPVGVFPDGSVAPVPAASPRVSHALDVGAPHWCNEFDSTNVAQREACRAFVKTTTTLQSIETLQHGLGFVHTSEPRERFHFDGDLSSVGRAYELLTDPSDVVGQLLHSMVNQYTTVGLTTVWGQNISEWNGVAPHAGMQASLHRSHAREEMAAAEGHLAHAIQLAAQRPADARVQRLLERAVTAQQRGARAYGEWKYARSIQQAMRVLSLVDRALTRLGEPNRIHDPLSP